MIEEKIIELNKKVNALENVTGFKKSINEFNKINKEIEQCMSELTSLESKIQEISIEKEEPNITDEEFMENLEYLKSLVEKFDDFPLTEQIRLYHEGLQKIKLNDKFLKSQKTEIIYLDKKNCI